MRPLALRIPLSLPSSALTPSYDRTNGTIADPILYGCTLGRTPLDQSFFSRETVG